MLRLFIEKQEIELTDDVQVAITKQFEDLSNPTSIINDWSKTVSIPFTAKNNAVFGNIFRPDRLIAASNDSSDKTGIFFNPLQKLDFRLEWDNAIVMVGYAKMNEIKQVGGKGTYEITLFGELGKVFQEMKKITFDTSSPDTDYIINGSQYVQETINKELVRDSWYHSGQSTDILRKKTDAHYNFHDIVGFAPNNSFSEGFEYKSYQLTSNTSQEFTETLGDAFTQATGIEPSTAIPNGLLPREIGEYRSYYQLPFIYWSKLFRIFQEKAEEVTGYQFELSEDWFNQSNPYWYDLVYMLRPLNSLKNTTYNNKYESTFTSNLTCYSIYYGTSYSFGRYEPGMTWDIAREQMPLLVNPQSQHPHYFNFNPHQTVDGQISVHLKFNVAYNNVSDTVRIRNNSVFVIKVYMTDEATGHSETSTVTLGTIALKYTDSPYSPSATYTENIGNKALSGSGTWTLIDKDYSFTIPTNMYDKQYKITWSLTGYNAEGSNLSMFVTTRPATIYLGNIDMYCLPNQLNLNITPMIGKSFSTFTLNDLWNSEFNVFNEILKYCKIYRIGISVDEFNRRVIFKPYTKYFKDYNVVDWTDKIDMSKDFVIKPVTLENKYILFNYEDNKTKLGSSYKDKYGVNYGDYRLITEYNFNSETKNLFEKIKTSIVNTDNVLSWSNLYDYHTIIYSFPNEIMVYNKDKDSKQVDIFGSFFFHNGTTSFSNEDALHLRSVKISDDTTFQQINNTYFYTQGAAPTLTVEYYPLLDIVKGKNMCVFNIPKENYTYINNYANKNTIYHNFWEKYINERYNVQNKKITCYVKLNPTEYNSFDWNKLVKIDNQLCVVNKIYDYDVQSSSPTKVDLITIQDMYGYNSDNYSYDYIITEPKELTIPYDHYKLLEVKSTRPWSIYYNEWSDALTADPEEGPSGVTTVIVGSIDEEHGHTLIFESYDENEETIASTSVPCYVGGTATVSASPWYNRVDPEETATVSITAPNTSWEVYRINNGDNNNRKVNISPMSGVGSQNIDVSVPSDSDTGLVEVYIKDINSDNLTAFRVDIPLHTLVPSEKVIVMSKNSTKQITVSDTSNAGWRLISQTNVTSTSMSPTTGNQGTTTVTFTSHSTVGTDTYTIRNGNMEEVTITVVVCNDMDVLNSTGTARQSTDSVEYHGLSSTRGYKVYSTRPWSASLPQGVSAYGASSGGTGITDVTFNWGSGSINSSKTITFNNNAATANLVCTYTSGSISL